MRPSSEEAFSSQDQENYFGEMELTAPAFLPFTPDGDWDDGVYYPGDDA